MQTLYRASGARAWDVTLETFARAVDVGVQHRFRGDTPNAGEVDAFVRSLHVEDLALACACRDGHEAAWEHFIRELRPQLYAAARSIAREDRARDLVDSLFADLFGLSAREGERRSLLAYYHGRSRLVTWLRTVLAQRHVDAARAAARTVSLDTSERDEATAPASATGGAAAAPSAGDVPNPDRRRYVALAQQALDAAIATLDARDRLRLRLYYGEGVRLAGIGKVLGEHEATVSRKIERARRQLRKEVVRLLTVTHGLQQRPWRSAWSRQRQPRSSTHRSCSCGTNHEAQESPIQTFSGEGAGVERRASDEPIERLLKQSAWNEAAASEACPDTDVLAAFVDGALDRVARREVERHAAACARCAQVLAVVANADASPSGRPPASWLPRLRWMIPLATAATVAAIWVATSSLQNTVLPRNGATIAEESPASGPDLPPAAPAAEDQSRRTDAFNDGAATPQSSAERRESAAAPVDGTSRTEGDALGAPAAPPAAAPVPAEEAFTLAAETPADLAATARAGANASQWRWRGRTVERSVDGGLTWTAEYDAGRTVLAGAVVSPDVAWFVGERGLIVRRTATGWSTVTPPADVDVAPIEAAGISEATVKLADGRTFYTADAGVTWTPR